MAKYTIVALQLLTFVLLTNAMNLPTKCSDLPTKQDFKPLEYFNGQWYTTYAYVSGVKQPIDYIPCNITTEEALGTDYIREFTSNYLPKFDMFYFVETLIPMSEMAHGKGKFEAITRLIGPNGSPLSPFFNVSANVLDTDYMNYAVLQTCQQINSFVEEDYIILSRKQGTEIPSSPKIEEMLQRIGLKLNDFFKIIEGVQCKKDPNMKHM